MLRLRSLRTAGCAVNALLKARGLLVSQDGGRVDHPRGKFDQECHRPADASDQQGQSVVFWGEDPPHSKWPICSRKSDRVVFGDGGYASDEDKRGTPLWDDLAGPGQGQAQGSLDAGLFRPPAKRNRRNSGIRAQVEHVFRIVERHFGYTKVRNRGLAKNAAQVMTLIGLANLYALRGRLAAP